jgi:hypothetical protein
VIERAMDSGQRLRRSRYRAGELVRVKSAAQIAATLDSDGRFEALPFMPEMAAFCGQVYRVRSSAHKTCDSAEMSGMRRMNASVHLEGLRCDGSAHGGCQSRCPLFFKDAWLEPAGPSPAEPASGGPASAALGELAGRSTRLHGRNPDEGTYSCQATEIPAATVPLGFSSIRQYWDDVRSGNLTLAALLRALPVMLFNKYQRLSTRVLPRRLLIRDGHPHPEIAGTLERTPDLRLGLRPGDTVEIRSHREILETLDANGANRGLAFDQDMVPFCGRQATVHHRVERRIDERTGKLTYMKNSCLVLDGITCRGHYHRFCPRGIDSYWREIWLRRADDV